MHKALKVTAIGAALTVALGATTAIAADGGVPGGLDQINATLNALIASVASLQKSIAELTSAVTPAAPSNILLTSPVGGTDAVCWGTNVSSTPMTVLVEMFGSSGTILASQTLLMQPQHVQGIFPSSGGLTTFHCRFTILVGNASQLRANAYAGGAVAEAR